MRTITVIEDSLDQRELLAEVLGGPGVDVRCYGDPLEAFEAMRADPPDLLLLDWYLPKMSGRALVSELRGTPECCLVPIVVITGALHLDAAGVDAVLMKPVDLEELLEVTARMLGDVPPPRREPISRHAFGP